MEYRNTSLRGQTAFQILSSGLFFLLVPFSWADLLVFVAGALSEPQRLRDPDVYAECLLLS